MTRPSADAPTPHPLAAGFPTRDLAHWRHLAQQALGDADFDRALTRLTADAIARGPLFTRADVAGLDLAPPPRAGATAFLAAGVSLPWDIRERIDHPDPTRAREDALTGLTGGASSLELALDPQGHAGVALTEPAELAALLAGIRPEAARVSLDAPRDAPSWAASLLDWAQADAGATPAELRLGLNLDPLTAAARTGGDAGPAVAAATALLDRLSAFRHAGLLRADGRLVHETGGTQAQELAWTAAAGLAYLRALMARGLDADAAAARLVFALSLDADIHLGAVKLRAFRRLWARAAAAQGAAASGQAARLEAHGSRRMLAKRDAWNNIIRLAAAGAAAALGGADAIVLPPFTAPLGPATPFARRISRNLHILLQEEAHLGVVADPAAGSFLHEALTDRLARAAWSLLQEMEAAGGAAALLASGKLAAALAETRVRAQAAYARRKEGLLGVSDYAILEDLRPVEVEPGFLPPEPDPAAPFAPIRWAAPFERLRDAADRYAARTGRHPTALVAALGPERDHGPRATWTANLLAAGGVAVASAFEGANPGAHVAALKAANTRLAVLCGTDEAYDRAAPSIAALREAGATVWLAGRPGVREAALRNAGVADFVFAGMDALAALARAHAELGVEELP